MPKGTFVFASHSIFRGKNWRKREKRGLRNRRRWPDSVRLSVLFYSAPLISPFATWYFLICYFLDSSNQVLFFCFTLIY